MARQLSRAMPPHSYTSGVLWLLFVLLSTVACNLPTSLPTPDPTTPLPSPTPTLIQVSPLPPLAPSPTLPFPDASSVLAGVCFGYLATLDGQTVVLDSPRDLAGFYDRVDKSKLCRGTVERQQFDFSTRQIVGTVVTGTGCTVDVAYQETIQDDQAHQRTINFRVALNGDCPYELVHPIWLAIDRPLPGYTTQLQITR